MSAGRDRYGVEYWESVAERWTGRRTGRLWRTHSDAVNARWLSEWLPDGRARRCLKTDLFDEAVATGLFPCLADRAATVVGVDLTTATARRARERHPELRAARGDLRRLPFADGSFDVIVSNSSLDHFQVLADLVAALDELHRVLAPGGVLLLTLDNPANPVVALRNALPFRLARGLGIVPYYVGATVGPRRLPALLRERGFEVERVTTLLHCPRLVALRLAGALERLAGPRGQRLFLRGLLKCEGLAAWPTRSVSGHFVAARAVRPR